MRISDPVLSSNIRKSTAILRATLDAIARDLTSESQDSSVRFQAGLPVSGQAEGAQLDKRGVALTPTSQPKAEARGGVVARWKLKHIVSEILRDVTQPGKSTPGVCKCGTAGYQSSAVHLVRRGARPGVKGVYFCDSPWLCPSCAPRRAAERAERVQRVFDATERKGGAVVFLTLTVQHVKGQALADLKKLVMSACTKARQGRPWQLAKERYGIAGVMVGPEVTWSPAHGWHFHLHVAVPMLLQGDWSSVVAKAEEGGRWIVGRYRDYIKAAGGHADDAGQDVQVMWRQEDLADYLAKGSGAWEVASAGATKQGKKGLTPWDLAARASTTRYRALFAEYAAVMPGTRSCVITKALADALGIQPEGDEDAPGVDESQEDDVEIVGSVEPPRWHRLLRGGHVPAVFQAVEDRRPWEDIDRMMTALLDPPPLGHAPSAWEMAQRVKATRHMFRRVGEAIQAAMDQERQHAARLGRHFEPPPLRRVLELVAA